MKKFATNKPLSLSRPVKRKIKIHVRERKHLKSLSSATHVTFDIFLFLALSLFLFQQQSFKTFSL